MSESAEPVSRGGGRYPRTSGGARGVWALGPEVWLALTLGALRAFAPAPAVEVVEAAAWDEPVEVEAPVAPVAEAPAAQTTVDVGPSSSRPSSEVRTTSSAPARAACR